MDAIDVPVCLMTEPLPTYFLRVVIHSPHASSSLLTTNHHSAPHPTCSHITRSRKVTTSSLSGTVIGSTSGIRIVHRGNHEG